MGVFFFFVFFSMNIGHLEGLFQSTLHYRYCLFFSNEWILLWILFNVTKKMGSIYKYICVYLQHHHCYPIVLAWRPQTAPFYGGSYLFWWNHVSSRAQFWSWCHGKVFGSWKDGTVKLSALFIWVQTLNIIPKSILADTSLILMACFQGHSLWS